MDLLRMTDEMQKTVNRSIQSGKTPSNSHRAMGTEEILGIIHKEGIEAEVFKALSIWLVNVREAQIKGSEQQKAIIRTIGKIANKNPNRAEALDGVKALCESGLEEDEDIERE